MTDRLPAQTHIGAVALTVSDLDRALDYYTHALGFTLIARQGETAALGAGGAQPLLHLQSGGTPRPTRATGLYHFAILHPTRRDLARAVMHLIREQVPVTGASDHGVSEAIYLSDPDGNGIEIYADRPREAWPRLADGDMSMATDPLDVDNLLAEVDPAEQTWPGLDPATTVGHVHLHVADLNASERFYTQLIGFDLIMRYGQAAGFFSAGGYHHHLGANTWAGVNAPPPPPGSVGLRWFELHLPDARSREALLARLDVARWPYQPQDGGCLTRDPAGNGILIVSA